MTRLTSEQVKFYKEKLNEFLSIYGHLYQAKDISFIHEHFLDELFEQGIEIDIMCQIYELIGVHDVVKNNSYQVYLDALVNNYDINQNLLEVGCGFIPAFAMKLKKIQNCGTITAIDPSLKLLNVEGIKVIKGKFDENYDLSNIDLIYGVQPCEGIIDMIKLANKNDIDLFVQPCGCTHFPKEYLDDYRSVVTLDAWIYYLEGLMKETIPDTREYSIDCYDDLYTPIFRTRKLINK